MRKLLLWPAVLIPFIATFSVLVGNWDLSLFLTVAVECLIGWICLGFYRAEETALKWIWFAIYPVVCFGVPGLLLLLVVGLEMR